MTDCSHLDGKTVFVAGSTGLTGINLINTIVEQHPNTRVKGAYLATEPVLKHDRVSYVQADLTTREGCRKAVKGCNLAVLAAATTGGSVAMSAKPHRQVTGNLMIDALLLEALHLEGIRKFVYLSSAIVYQEFDGFISEDQLDLNRDPFTTYLGIGWVKRAAEKLCQFWYEKYGMKAVILRCANIYGPYDKFNPAVSNFIPALVRKAVDRMDPFEVWGSPHVVRDVVYVQDLVEAILMLLSSGSIAFDIFNLGYGETVTVGEVAELCLKYAEHEGAGLKFTDNSPGSIGYRAIDCSKIRRALNWKPKYPIEKGIAETTRWWIENKEEWKK